MKKTCTLIINLLFVGVILAQEKLPNPKIGKNETEITSFIMTDYKLAYGGQFIYRLSVLRKLKTGAGILYGANYTSDAIGQSTHGYGAVFADILQFLGHRQKWSLGGQLGQGIYNDDYVKAGIYYSISGNYRAIVSKKLLFATSLFIGYRNFHNSYGYSVYNTVLVGLKAGIVF